MGQRFRVNRDVLIPRPETEELVQWILGDEDLSASPLILDIGTGSGCIPIMLKKKWPMANVHTVDVSAGALAIAQQNALDLKAELAFHQADFLDEETWDALPAADIIVSNPPYVPLVEKASMASHVVDYEPHVALFVPDEDALLFYRQILRFAGHKLRKGGRIYVETHYNLAQQVAALAEQSEVRQDMFGKERMVRIQM
jgi:release factor glutamine methyltransferase